MTDWQTFDFNLLTQGKCHWLGVPRLPMSKFVYHHAGVPTNKWALKHLEKYHNKLAKKFRSYRTSDI